MGKEIEIEGYDEVLRELEHDELVKGLGKVISEIATLSKSENEIGEYLKGLPEVFRKHTEAIIAAIPKPVTPEVKVDVSYQEIVNLLDKRENETVGKIEALIKAIVDRPNPKKLIAVRGGWQGTGLIKEIIIEYNK